MEVLGIGPLEFAVIILIMFIVLGPDQMVKTARMFGEVVQKVRKSNLWKEISTLRTLPQTLVNQAGLEEFEEINTTLKEVNRDINAWTKTPMIQPDTMQENAQEQLPSTYSETSDTKGSKASNFGTWETPTNDNLLDDNISNQEQSLDKKQENSSLLPANEED